MTVTLRIPKFPYVFEFCCHLSMSAAVNILPISVSFVVISFTISYWYQKPAADNAA